MAGRTKEGVLGDHQHIIDNRPDLHHIIVNPHPLHKAIVEAAKLKMAGMPEAASKPEEVKETEANVKPEATSEESSKTDSGPAPTISKYNSTEAIHLDNGTNKPDLIGTIAVLEDDGGNSTSWI